jgi:hypothetical protein
MSFFDIGRYREDHYAKNKCAAENKRLQEEIEMARYRQRQDDYDREQQHFREKTQQERQRENDREYRWNMLSERDNLRDELEDLKLRRKFGIEEEE